MVFEKLAENIESNQYLKKHEVKKDGKVSLHLRIDPEIYNNLTKIVAVYRNYKIDTKLLSKSDLGAIIFREWFDNLPDDETAILNLFSKLKAYRDESENKG